MKNKNQIDLIGLSPNGSGYLQQGGWSFRLASFRKLKLNALTLIVVAFLKTRVVFFKSSSTADPNLPWPSNVSGKKILSWRINHSTFDRSNCWGKHAVFSSLLSSHSNSSRREYKCIEKKIARDVRLCWLNNRITNVSEIYYPCILLVWRKNQFTHLTVCVYNIM